MKIFHLPDLQEEPVDPDHFTGEATLTRMDHLSEDPRVNAYRVSFQPGARAAWHSHSGPQVLLVVEGRCRFQKEGEPIQEVSGGGAVCIAPGEKHWHGSTPNAPMVHVALNINAMTNWLEKVSELHYEGQPQISNI